MQLLYSDDFLDDLDDLPTRDSQRIMEKLSLMQQGSSVDVKKLQGRNDYRLRVGNYRILFTKAKDVIDVQRILQRKDAYK